MQEALGWETPTEGYCLEEGKFSAGREWRAFHSLEQRLVSRGNPAARNVLSPETVSGFITIYNYK